MSDLSVTPFEVVAGPAHVFVAPADTAEPQPDAQPGATPTGYTDLGFTDGGVTVQHSQTINEIRVDQTVYPVKAIRTELSVMVSFTMVELTLENYIIAVNGVPGTDVPSTQATYNQIDLNPGVAVKTMALVVRGPSPYGGAGDTEETDWSMQYWLPRAYMSGNPQVQFTRDNKAGLALEFKVLGTASAFGHLRARTA